MILAVYSSPDDIVIQSAKKCSAITLVSLESLIKGANINDEIVNGTPRIHWTLEDGRVIENLPEIYLLNRAMQFPHSALGDIHPDDREFAEAEWRAYFNFALSSFKSASAKPGPFGLSNAIISLPLQWKLAQEQRADLDTPDFYLGPRSRLPKKFEESKYLESDLFDYFGWKQSIASNQGDSDFCFFKERPQGIPWISTIVGTDSEEFSPLDSSVKLSTAQRLKLKEISKSLASRFGQEIVELLFFVDGDHFTFGSANNALIGSRTNRAVKIMIADFLKEKLKGTFDRVA